MFIDELDATLFPGAQLKCVRRLNQIAGELDLQVIFTTHSLEVLEEVQKLRGQGQSHTIYLDKSRSKISVKLNHSIDQIRNDLRVSGPESPKRATKLKVYCEDNVARAFATNILVPENKRKVKVCSADLGEGVLQTIVGKFEELNNIMFILDGDVQIRSSRNVVTLPGPDYPEKIVYDFLRDLSKDDEFWEDSSHGYTKQFCFRDYSESSNANRVKNWYQQQKSYWGRNQSRLWNRWKKENTDLIESFNQGLSHKI